MQNSSIARRNAVGTLELLCIPVTERDDVEEAAQRVYEGLGDILRDAHATKDVNQLEQIRKVLYALAVEVASTQESVGHWTDHCASQDLPWGV